MAEGLSSQQPPYDPALQALHAALPGAQENAGEALLPADDPSAQITDEVLKVQGQILVEELSSGGVPYQADIRSDKKGRDGHGGKAAAPMVFGDSLNGK